MSAAALAAVIGKPASLSVEISKGRPSWQIPVVIRDARIRYNVTDYFVAQPDVSKPSERDGSGVWVESRRVTLSQ